MHLTRAQQRAPDAVVNLLRDQPRALEKKLLRGTGTKTNRAPNKETDELTRSSARKLTLANSQNAIDFDNLRVTKISTSKRLRVRISMSPKQRERIC